MYCALGKTHYANFLSKAEFQLGRFFLTQSKVKKAPKHGFDILGGFWGLFRGKTHLGPPLFFLKIKGLILPLGAFFNQKKRGKKKPKNFFGFKKKKGGWGKKSFRDPLFFKNFKPIFPPRGFFNRGGKSLKRNKRGFFWTYWSFLGGVGKKNSLLFFPREFFPN